MNSTQSIQKMFQEQIKPVRVEGKKSPIIFAGPHNEKYVPPSLYTDDKPLGLPPEYFQTRHEASDLHAQDLFETLWEKAPYIQTITGQLSRLVVDLNRISNRIPKISSDTGEIIPGNLDLSPEEVAWRIKQYDDYHQTKCDLINEALQEFGQVIYLDIHTFNRTFKGEERSVDIGTFKPEPSTLSQLAERSLANHIGNDYTFCPDKPYNTKDSKTNAGAAIAKKTNVDFLGIEICNDLLTTQAGRDKIVGILVEVLYDIMPKYNLERHLPPREDAIMHFNI